jgi:hypothetical protein
VRDAGQSGRGRGVQVEHAAHHDVAEQVTQILA